MKDVSPLLFTKYYVKIKNAIIIFFLATLLLLFLLRFIILAFLQYNIYIHEKTQCIFIKNEGIQAVNYIENYRIKNGKIPLNNDKVIRMYEKKGISYSTQHLEELEEYLLILINSNNKGYYDHSIAYNSLSKKWIANFRIYDCKIDNFILE